MKIGKKDIFWNYSATFLKIASSALVLPFILKNMSSDTVGIWVIYSTVSSIIILFDFGFNASFTRNISYVFSGVNELKQNGFILNASGELNGVNYSLLKGLIRLMRWFYLRISLILLAILLFFGSFYIYSVTRAYTGSHEDIYVSWVLLCLISAYSLYTTYYDSLLLGRGLVKRSKQIIIVGQIVYLVIAILFVNIGLGLVAIVSAQIISVVIIRVFSYKSFFTIELKNELDLVQAFDKNELLRAISPNAIKLGLTALGGFLVTRSSIFIGSLYLSLSDIASYGITLQLINVISALSGIYIATYLPLISQLRIVDDISKIKYLSLNGFLISLFTFVVGGFFLIFLGPKLLAMINSATNLMSEMFILIALVVSFLELIHSSAGTLLVSKNEVPFFIPSLISGTCSVVILFGMLIFTKLSVLSLILAPGLSQLVYQNWKWPYEVVKDLHITWRDVKFNVVTLGGIKRPI